jgi:hypothetical protein
MVIKIEKKYYNDASSLIMDLEFRTVYEEDTGMEITMKKGVIVAKAKDGSEIVNYPISVNNRRLYSIKRLIY